MYELVKIKQNEKINSKMSKIQAAARRERSAIDNLIIMNIIIENQSPQKLNTYLFFADAVKCFNKLWLKDCLLEMYNLGYGPNTLNFFLHEILHETNNIYNNYNTSREHRRYIVQRSGKTRHNIWTHHVLCRNIHS